jgi:hypothetical protein
MVHIFSNHRVQIHLEELKSIRTGVHIQYPIFVSIFKILKLNIYDVGIRLDLMLHNWHYSYIWISIWETLQLSVFVSVGIYTTVFDRLHLVFWSWRFIKHALNVYSTTTIVATYGWEQQTPSNNNHTIRASLLLLLTAPWLHAISFSHHRAL